MGIIFPEILTKKRVKYNVIPIGIKTTIPAIKLFLNFENSDFFIFFSILRIARINYKNIINIKIAINNLLFKIMNLNKCIT